MQFKVDAWVNSGKDNELRCQSVMWSAPPAEEVDVKDFGRSFSELKHMYQEQLALCKTW